MIQTFAAHAKALALRAALAAIALQPCALSYAATGCKLVRIAEWPVRLHNNRVVVDGSISGQEIGVLLDTGAASSALSRSAAQRLGLLLHETADRYAGVGGLTRVWTTEIPELTIAGATRRDWRVRVIGEREFGKDASFILGYDFFRQVDIEFDFARAAVRLFRPVDCKDQSLAYWATPGAVSEVSIAWSSETGHLSVPIQLNGKPLEAIIDSGAMMSAVGMGTADELGFTPQSPGVLSSGTVSGIGDSIVNYWTAPFATFAIGNEVIRNPTIPFMRLSAYFGATAMATTWDRWPMILGADFLRAHRVYIAHSQQKVYFTYTGGPVFGPKKDRGRDQDRTIAAYDESLRANPANAVVYYNRALAKLAKGDTDAAITDYGEAIRLRPRYASAYLERGNAWMVKGDARRAIADYGEAIRINPKDTIAYFSRASAWTRAGDVSRAVADYDEAIRINPDDAALFNNTAWLLAVSKDDAVRDGKRAIDLAKRACELSSWEDPMYLDTLAAAYAELGDFQEAVRWQEKALAFPEFEKTGGGAKARLALYRSGKPYREGQQRAE